MTGPVAWSSASWLNPPLSAVEDGPDLLVTTRDKGDFWRTTSYGFVHDDGHALLTPLPEGTAVEVSFKAELTELYDQAGLFLRVDPETWIKAGVEFCDGAAQLGAVVTHTYSDWSQAPVPDWTGHEITLRASRSGDAITIRARRGDDPWQMIRLAHLPPDATVTAGPYCCSPSRESLTVRFTRFTLTESDSSLH